ncbi:hypothetical protein AXG93_4202s1050 [Marchantia polymorpha subsp. ruderalis]|uniref:Uncharacterized protein n=1 Tax=Marchantia polymorpha subsp. ruderalis TaxID=1480154 RepID=A0A176WHL8_MARPO|nr:hypothetical protein AXG93_4202s1050 [Marchantia polymorpha subsp. ruderalis]
MTCHVVDSAVNGKRGTLHVAAACDPSGSRRDEAGALADDRRDHVEGTSTRSAESLAWAPPRKREESREMMRDDAILPFLFWEPQEVPLRLQTVGGKLWKGIISFHVWGVYEAGRNVQS